MNRRFEWLTLAGTTLLLATPAHGIDQKYARQLERSGCTQASELQGCDITRTRAENAKAGFVTESTTAGKHEGAGTAPSPYAGTWVAVGPDGRTVADILVDGKDGVKVNGKSVKARRIDGGLLFRQGSITFFIQGDRRLKGEDYWQDSHASSRGLIEAR